MKMPLPIIIAASLLLLTAGCSSERTPGTKSTQSGGGQTADPAAALSGQTMPRSAASAYALEIVPAEASRSSFLSLRASGFTLADATVQWIVNGQAVPGVVFAGGAVSSLPVRKGDSLQARVVVQGVEILSNTVRIVNALPEVEKAALLPEVFKSGGTLSVEATGVDADEDPVTLSYEWTKNGEAAGAERQIAGVIKRGDKVSVRVTPSDGEAYGRPSVIQREIRNLPPTIAEDRSFRFDGSVYQHTVRASDPDGDQIEYLLRSGPQGMTINPTTGLLRWTVPPEFTGRATFEVAASDGQGGEAQQTLHFDVSPGRAR